ncbi:hypothetical protein [Deinococcus sp. QL22]|uniref:hypothetical protein n=1 Tax=Deinococcus sp. QL22 TaxID=2939437 RepID=UPI00201838E1|nr:hypothetical protein [Deinococcus sp. QL22]UQN09284.1 hypothetical protein M1R55_22175 [Deinococcus sp. QL22]
MPSTTAEGRTSSFTATLHAHAYAVMSQSIPMITRVAADSFETFWNTSSARS